jgi:hypothetical protein
MGAVIFVVWVWGVVFLFAAIPGVVIGWVAGAMLGYRRGIVVSVMISIGAISRFRRGSPALVSSPDRLILGDRRPLTRYQPWSYRQPHQNSDDAVDSTSNAIPCKRQPSPSPVSRNKADMFCCWALFGPLRDVRVESVMRSQPEVRGRRKRGLSPVRSDGNESIVVGLLAG